MLRIKFVTSLRSVTKHYYVLDLGWYAEFLLEIILKILLGKTSARLNLKIMLNSLD